MSKPNKNHKAKCERYKQMGTRDINKDKKRKRMEELAAEGKPYKKARRFREKTLDMAWDRLFRKTFSQYKPPSKDSNEFDMKPKKLNKTCVR